MHTEDTQPTAPAEAPVDAAADAKERAIESWRRMARNNRDRADRRPGLLGFLARRDRRNADRMDAYADEIAEMTPAEYLRQLHDGY